MADFGILLEAMKGGSIELFGQGGAGSTTSQPERAMANTSSMGNGRFRTGPTTTTWSSTKKSSRR